MDIFYVDRMINLFFTTNSAGDYLPTLFVANIFVTCTICRILSIPFVANILTISTICRRHLYHLSYFIYTICRIPSIPFVVNIYTICRKK